MATLKIKHDTEEGEIYVNSDTYDSSGAKLRFEVFVSWKGRGNEPPPLSTLITHQTPSSPLCRDHSLVGLLEPPTASALPAAWIACEGVTKRGALVYGRLA